MVHILPELGYGFDSLEPHIDSQTMEIHHDKHHAGYVKKLNKALEGHEDLQDKDVKELLSDLSVLPEDKKQAIINNGGGHYNHSLFWPLLKKDVSADENLEIIKAIKERFESLDTFKEKFADAATSRFGSGWAWLVLDKGKLEITSTANQDSPISDGKEPIIGLDVWEHAYYLKYKNQRAEYINSFWNVLNWEQANKNFLEVKNK